MRGRLLQLCGCWVRGGVLFELSVGLLCAMFFGVYLDAGGAEGEEALFVFAEVEDEFLGVEGAALGLVNLFHGNRNQTNIIKIKVLLSKFKKISTLLSTCRIYLLCLDL